MTAEQELEKKQIGEELAHWLPFDEAYCKQLVVASHLSGLVTDEEFHVLQDELDTYYSKLVATDATPLNFMPVKLDKKYADFIDKQ